MRALEWVGLCRTVSAPEVLRAHAARLEALAGQVTARNRLHHACGLTHPHPTPSTPTAETPVGAVALE
ncbi:hypothetical protein [Streptomyces sp. DH37]|uniref:hypothetical protein n=1 Tax=Streptomyces sp. DH37 TaxID=3040122 RepID=UPI0024424B28|nr:hypothetical protein [Streptomyces sp. DH37]MDG9703863.1 hypothetical protein [Streptomyces sp. DH37]